MRRSRPSFLSFGSGSLANKKEAMKLCVLLSRLTGWSRAEVMALPMDELEGWLEAARSVDAMMRL